MTLVDTDVLIAHLRGVEAARDWLRQTRLAGPLTISAVTVTEISGGMRAGEKRDVWALLNAMLIEPVTEVTARRAGELMRQYRHSHTGIGLGDYLIAATAEILGAGLATLNVRHFPMIPDLKPPFKLTLPAGER